MARIRSIHPGLFSDPEFADLTDAAQVFYLGLLTEADDQGVFEWKPTTLRIRLRPTKDGPVEGLLSELEAANKVVSYEIDGRKYGAIRKFTQWQRPKSPKSWHPIPDHFRSYAGSSGAISEITDPQPPPIPPIREIPPQRKEEGDSSEAKASGADAPGDVASVIFGQGLAWLQNTSKKSRDNCASQLGKWRKQIGDEALISLLGRAQREGVLAPMDWMEGAIKHHKSATDPPASRGWN